MEGGGVLKRSILALFRGVGVGDRSFESFLAVIGADLLLGDLSNEASSSLEESALERYGLLSVAERSVVPPLSLFSIFAAVLVNVQLVGRHVLVLHA